ncbi:MAG: beta-galactosidase [Muribaculaceae bacterium]|nr:beta-galactosidase [Muribaculaceae bacterium]
MKSTFISVLACASILFGAITTSAYDFSKSQIPDVKWDVQSLIIDGERVTPVMGEIHYSRLPENEWRSSVRKMKDGGVTLIATYVFWNHIEQNEGKFDWSGQRNLRKFLEICKEEGMPVVLRVGPFCHGEARNGGIPDWIFDNGIKSRTEDPAFLDAVTKLYRQIFTQVQGLQWKDGGPVMACQFDNEYRGHGSYLMSLKKIANEIGFDLPFYTRTGWPELKTPVPYGEMIPLYGDYADGFWERSIEPTAGNYYKAFNFKPFRSSTAIASEQLKDQKEKLTEGDELYPYFTCELGGGMMGAYHRRPWIYPEDAYSLAVVKLGSGSNLLGYYMYHGGTNPESDIYLNETQRTKATNYNDLPVKNYDFQAPLGEFGQAYPHYYTLRKLHLFMQDYGNILAPMEAMFPAPQDIAKGDDSTLRYSYRTDGKSGFVFINNYERLQNITAKKGIRFDLCGVEFPSKPITIPAGTTCIFPVNIDGIRYATAQLIAKRDGKIFLEQIPGIPTEIAIGNKVMKNVKALGASKPIYDNVYLLTSDQASRLFLPEKESVAIPSRQPKIGKSKEAGAPRTISIGVNKAAESPEDADFEQAAVYTISNLPDAEERENILLRIDYRGDVARLYCDGKLIADNFYNGRPMLYGLWRLPKSANKLELRILPLQENMPVYFPIEADVTPEEEVYSISLMHN